MPRKGQKKADEFQEKKATQSTKKGKENKLPARENVENVSPIQQKTVADNTGTLVTANKRPRRAAAMVAREKMLHSVPEAASFHNIPTKPLDINVTKDKLVKSTRQRTFAQPIENENAIAKESPDIKVSAGTTKKPTRKVQLDAKKPSKCQPTAKSKPKIEATIDFPDTPKKPDVILAEEEAVKTVSKACVYSKSKSSRCTPPPNRVEVQSQANLRSGESVEEDAEFALINKQLVEAAAAVISSRDSSTEKKRKRAVRDKLKPEAAGSGAQVNSPVLQSKKRAARYKLTQSQAADVSPSENKILKLDSGLKISKDEKGTGDSPNQDQQPNKEAAKSKPTTRSTRQKGSETAAPCTSTKTGQQLDTENKCVQQHNKKTKIPVASSLNNVKFTNHKDFHKVTVPTDKGGVSSLSQVTTLKFSPKCTLIDQPAGAASLTKPKTRRELNNLETPLSLKQSKPTLSDTNLNENSTRPKYLREIVGSVSKIVHLSEKAYTAVSSEGRTAEPQDLEAVSSSLPQMGSTQLCMEVCSVSKNNKQAKIIEKTKVLAKCGSKITEKMSAMPGCSNGENCHQSNHTDQSRTRAEGYKTDQVGSRLMQIPRTSGESKISFQSVDSSTSERPIYCSTPDDMAMCSEQPVSSCHFDSLPRKHHPDYQRFNSFILL